MSDRELFEKLIQVFRDGKEKEFLFRRARWAMWQRQKAALLQSCLGADTREYTSFPRKSQV